MPRISIKKPVYYSRRKRYSDSRAAARQARYSASRYRRATVNAPLEKKFIDLAEAGYACSTAGSVTYISGTSTGDDDTSRDGRQIFASSIQVHGIVRPEADTTDPCYCRVLLIQDKQPNGVLATIGDIFAAGTSTSFMNLNNRDRFVILSEWSGVVGKVNTTATQAIAGSPTVQAVKLYKDLRDLKITYSGTTGAIANAATNALLLVTIGNIAAGAAAIFTAGCRMRFYD